MIRVLHLRDTGDDIAVCDAARVVLEKRTSWLEPPGFDTVTRQFTPGKLRDKDCSLIHFLERGMSSRDWDRHIDMLVGCHDRTEVERIVRHLRSSPPHWTPFSHVVVGVHVTAPLFLARQIWKSHVGFSGGDCGYPGFSEESRRYIDSEPQFWHPTAWRRRAANVKQGSGGAFHDTEQAEIDIVYDDAMADALNHYNDLLARNVAPEQARAVLPTSTIVEWHSTASIAAWARLYGLRSDPNAQREANQLADQISAICAPVAPVSWAALTGQVVSDTPAGFDAAATAALR